MAKADLTAARLRELLDYDPATGVFRRRASCSNFRAGAGAVAGTEYDGYVQIWVDNKQYRAHRLAWLYVHGEWPAGIIDHINGVRSDNRIANLRDVDHAINQQNRHATYGASGLMGAFWSERDQKWRSSIHVNRKLIHLGMFDTAQEAHAAYVRAKRKYHPESQVA